MDKQRTSPRGHNLYHPNDLRNGGEKLIALTFAGGTLFVISQILDERGYGRFSKMILPIMFGVLSLFLLWKMTRLFL